MAAFRLSNFFNFGAESEFWDQYEYWESMMKDRYTKLSKNQNRNIRAQHAMNMQDILNDPAVSPARRYNLGGFRDNVLRFNAILNSIDSEAAGLSFGDVFNVVGDNYVKLRVGRDEMQHPLAAILSTVNFQMDEADIKTLMNAGTGWSEALRQLSVDKGRTDVMRVGANIQTSYAARRTAQVMSGNVISGRKVMVFDTETVGLGADPSGVREVSWGMFDFDKNSMTMAQVGKPATERFRTTRMGLGRVVREGKTMSLEAAFDAMGGKLPGGDPGSGEIFNERLIGFLRDMRDADHVVAHNIPFDYEQTIGNLMRTSEYLNSKTITFGKESVDVRSLVDEVAGKFKTSDFVVDTRFLAMSFFGDMDVHQSLLARGARAPYSLENLVLQTNLLDLFREDLGDDFAKLVSEGAQHTGDYDTALTSKLFEYLLDPNGPATGRLQRRALTVGAFDSMDSVMQQALRNTLQGYAATPVSKIADIRDIAPELWRQLVDAGEAKVYNLGGELQTGSADDLRNSLLNKTSGLAFDANITPLEQQIWLGRHTQNALTIAKDVSAETILLHQGRWKGLSGYSTPQQGFLNEDMSLFSRGSLPTDQEYRIFQNQLADLGNQWADLALPERWLTNSLAVASSHDTAVSAGLSQFGPEKTLAEIGDDLGVIRWNAQSQAYISKSGKNVSLPLSILREAGIEGVGDIASSETSMLGLSAFEYSRDVDGVQRMVRQVNAQFGLDDTSAQQLADYLSTVKSEFDSGNADALIGNKKAIDLGLTPERLEQILGWLGDKEKYSRGVGVGYLGGQGGEEAYNALDSVMQGQLRDDANKLRFNTLFLNEEGGILRTAAVTLDRWTDRADLNRRGRATLEQSEEIMKTIIDNPMAARTAKFVHNSPALTEAAGKGYAIWKSLRTKIPVVAGVGALAGLGYYFYSKEKKEAPYEEPFERMPYEGSARQARVTPEMMIGSRALNQDHLETAALVGNMDRLSQNHTNMGNDRHSFLFNGVFG